MFFVSFYESILLTLSISCFRRDDPDLDKMMKERLRWGDPMAHLVKVNVDQLDLLVSQV